MTAAAPALLLAEAAAEEAEEAAPVTPARDWVVRVEPPMYEVVPLRKASQQLLSCKVEKSTREVQAYPTVVVLPPVVSTVPPMTVVPVALATTVMVMLWGMTDWVAFAAIVALLRREVMLWAMREEEIEAAAEEAAL